MWPHNLHDAWLLTLPAFVPYMVLMSLKMMERKTPFTSETFLHEYDYIVGEYQSRVAPPRPEPTAGASRTSSRVLLFAWRLFRASEPTPVGGLCRRQWRPSH